MSIFKPPPELEKDSISPKLMESFARAQTLQQQGELSDAIRLYDTVIAANSEFSEAYYKRANAKHGLKRWDDAVFDYDAAIALDPGHAKRFLQSRYRTRASLGAWKKRLRAMIAP